VIVNNSININKTNIHLSSQIIEHKQDHDVWRQSLTRVVGPYTLSNLCQRLYAKNLGKIRLLKGNLI
jgi:hypothetical protein